MSTIFRFGALFACAILLASCKDNLTREKAANAIAPHVDNKLAAQDAVDLLFPVNCWVPNEEGLRRLAGQYKAAQRELPRPLNELHRAGLIKDVIPVGLVVSQTKGYIYSDCFGVDMTPKNNFNGYPSNYLNLQKGLFRVELIDESRADIVRSDNADVFLGHGSSVNGTAMINYPGSRVTLALAKNKFGAVTGLSETLAEFNYAVEPTRTGTGWKGYKAQTRSGSAIFRKYDDGWRLVGLNVN